MIHNGEARELCPGHRAGGEHGYALVVVIWAIGLISLLFVTYIAAARYRSIEATSHKPSLFLTDDERDPGFMTQCLHHAAPTLPNSPRWRRKVGRYETSAKRAGPSQLKANGHVEQGRPL